MSSKQFILILLMFGMLMKTTLSTAASLLGVSTTTGVVAGVKEYNSSSFQQVFNGNSAVQVIDPLLGASFHIDNSFRSSSGGGTNERTQQRLLPLSRIVGKGLRIDVDLLEIATSGGLIRIAPTHYEFETANKMRWVTLVNDDQLSINAGDQTVLQIHRTSSAPSATGASAATTAADGDGYQLSVRGNGQFTDIVLSKTSAADMLARFCIADRLLSSYNINKSHDNSRAAASFSEEAVEVRCRIDTAGTHLSVQQSMDYMSKLLQATARTIVTLHDAHSAGAEADLGGDTQQQQQQQQPQNTGIRSGISLTAAAGSGMTAEEKALLGTVQTDLQILQKTMKILQKLAIPSQSTDPGLTNIFTQSHGKGLPRVDVPHADLLTLAEGWSHSDYIGYIWAAVRDNVSQEMRDSLPLLLSAEVERVMMGSNDKKGSDQSLPLSALSQLYVDIQENTLAELKSYLLGENNFYGSVSSSNNNDKEKLWIDVLQNQIINLLESKKDNTGHSPSENILSPLATALDTQMSVGFEILFNQSFSTAFAIEKDALSHALLASVETAVSEFQTLAHSLQTLSANASKNAANALNASQFVNIRMDELIRAQTENTTLIDAVSLLNDSVAVIQNLLFSTDFRAQFLEVPFAEFELKMQERHETMTEGYQAEIATLNTSLLFDLRNQSFAMQEMNVSVRTAMAEWAQKIENSQLNLWNETAQLMNQTNSTLRALLKTEILDKLHSMEANSTETWAMWNASVTERFASSDLLISDLSNFLHELAENVSLGDALFIEKSGEFAKNITDLQLDLQRKIETSVGDVQQTMEGKFSNDLRSLRENQSLLLKESVTQLTGNIDQLAENGSAVLARNNAILSRAITEINASVALSTDSLIESTQNSVESLQLSIDLVRDNGFSNISAVQTESLKEIASVENSTLRMLDFSTNALFDQIDETVEAFALALHSLEDTILVEIVPKFMENVSRVEESANEGIGRVNETIVEGIKGVREEVQMVNVSMSLALEQAKDELSNDLQSNLQNYSIELALFRSSAEVYQNFSNFSIAGLTQQVYSLQTNLTDFAEESSNIFNLKLSDLKTALESDTHRNITAMKNDLQVFEDLFHARVMEIFANLSFAIQQDKADATEALANNVSSLNLTIFHTSGELREEMGRILTLIRSETSSNVSDAIGIALEGFDKDLKIEINNLITVATDSAQQSAGEKIENLNVNVESSIGRLKDEVLKNGNATHAETLQKIEEVRSFHTKSIENLESEIYRSVEVIKGSLTTLQDEVFERDAQFEKYIIANLTQQQDTHTAAVEKVSRAFSSNLQLLKGEVLSSQEMELSAVNQSIDFLNTSVYAQIHGVSVKMEESFKEIAEALKYTQREMDEKLTERTTQLNSTVLHALSLAVRELRTHDIPALNLSMRAALASTQTAGATALVSESEKLSATFADKLIEAFSGAESKFQADLLALDARQTVAVREFVESRLEASAKTLREDWIQQSEMTMRKFSAEVLSELREDLAKSDQNSASTTETIVEEMSARFISQLEASYATVTHEMRDFCSEKMNAHVLSVQDELSTLFLSQTTITDDFSAQLSALKIEIGVLSKHAERSDREWGQVQEQCSQAERAFRQEISEKHRELEENLRGFILQQSVSAGATPSLGAGESTLGELKERMDTIAANLTAQQAVSTHIESILERVLSDLIYGPDTYLEMQRDSSDKPLKTTTTTIATAAVGGVDSSSNVESKTGAKSSAGIGKSKQRNAPEKNLSPDGPLTSSARSMPLFQRHAQEQIIALREDFQREKENMQSFLLQSQQHCFENTQNSTNAKLEQVSSWRVGVVRELSAIEVNTTRQLLSTNANIKDLQFTLQALTQQLQARQEEQTKHIENSIDKAVNLLKTDVRREMDTQAKETADLSSTVSQIQPTVTYLQTELAGAQQRVVELESKISLLQTDFHRRTQALEEKEQRDELLAIEERDSSAEKVEIQRKILENKIQEQAKLLMERENESKAQSIATEKEISTLQQQNSQFEKALREISEKWVDFEKKFTEKQDSLLLEVRVLTQELAVSRSESSKLEKEVTELRTESLRQARESATQDSVDQLRALLYDMQGGMLRHSGKVLELLTTSASSPASTVRSILTERDSAADVNVADKITDSAGKTSKIGSVMGLDEPPTSITNRA